MGNVSVSILLAQKWGDGRVDKRPGMQARTLAGSSLSVCSPHIPKGLGRAPSGT